MRARTPFRRRLTTSLLAALALAAAAPAAHAADATWHAVAPPIEDFPNSALALSFDAQGTGYASWTSLGAARLAPRPSAGAFGTPVPFPTSGGLPSVYGFGADGSGVFVGTATGSSVNGAFRSAGPTGAFGSLQPLGAGGIPAIAVNAAGQALATWGGTFMSSSGPLVAAFRQPGAAASFALEPLTGAGSPQVLTEFGISLTLPALDADGSAVVVYRDTVGSGSLQVVARANDGRWSGPTPLGAPVGAQPIGFAKNAFGDALVTWSEGETVRAAYRPRDGAFGAPQTIDQVGGIDRLRAFTLAMAADGTALVSLDRTTAMRRICTSGVSQGYTAELWRSVGGGAWTNVVRQEGQRGTVAASPTGDRVAFAWEGFVDPCEDQVATRAIRVQLGTLAALGPDTLMPDQPVGEITDVSNTSQSVAIDGAGNAILTWDATKPGASHKLRVMAYDTGSTPGGGGGGGGGNPPGGGGNPPGGGGDGGGDTPPGPDFADLLGLRAPVRRIPLTLDGSLPASVTVDARCLARRGTCAVNVNPTLGGSYSPGARASIAARRGRRARAVRFSIALPRVSARIAAGRSARLKVTIRGRALAKARAALRARGTAQLTIRMTVNGVAKDRPIVIRLVAARVRARRSG